MRLFVRGLTVLPLVLLVGLVAYSCGEGGTDPDPDPDPDNASITVVVTANGDDRSGVQVSLFAEGGTTALETDGTNSSGEAMFGGLAAGAYEVEVEVPTGLMLDAGEAERKSVTATAGATATASFALVDDPSSTVEEVLVTDNLTFEPSELTIAPGTTVRWRATGSMLHTITPEGHSEWSRAEVNQPGDTFEHTFDDTGSFPYFCEPHQPNMDGTVIVQ